MHTKLRRLRAILIAIKKNRPECRADLDEALNIISSLLNEDIPPNSKGSLLKELFVKIAGTVVGHVISEEYDNLSNDIGDEDEQ